MTIKTVGIIGAGTMGNGIAHIFSKGGFNVILCDVQQRLLDRGVADHRQEHGPRGRQAEADGRGKRRRHQAHHATIERNALAACDFIVEAATERFDIKSQLFRDLDAICKPEVILASNTSSISITKIGALTKRPEQVIGMHFFNPVPVMKLVEVIRGLATSDETYAT